MITDSSLRKHSETENNCTETADDSAVRTKVTALNKCIQQFIGSSLFIVYCLRAQSPVGHINSASHAHKRRGAQSSVSGLSLTNALSKGFVRTLIILLLGP